ncbi:MAG: putative toxin-antitoxin system antitoxin component (TIGR02293 family) [Candidatus Azotimanducaceae bacterium]|jgi:putative toxin-antitoxin system antitoxin component (TIGR02293 family)
MKYTPKIDDEPLLVEEAQAAYQDSPVQWVDRVMAGLPVAEFDSLREMLALPVDEMARMIGISTATLSRRRAKNDPLDRDHSDRLMRYARLYWLAVGFFDGNQPTGRDWLKRPARALDGRRPLDFAETEIGAREVEDLIGRLEYGVYA